MTMTSVDLITDFSETLKFPWIEHKPHRLPISLTWVSRDEITQAFLLEPVNDDTGLELLEKEVKLSQFLAFHGDTLKEAINRWPTLKFFAEWRLEHNGEGYLEVKQLEEFYAEIARDNSPTKMVVQFVEHY